MKATEVKVGDWVEVSNPWGSNFLKVREIRNGDAILGTGRMTARVFAGEDDPDCRKMDADEIESLCLN